MKRRKAAAIQRLHREDERLQPVGQVAAEGGDQRAEQREDEDPEEHRALVVPPDAGDLVEERLRRMRILDDVEEREIRDDVGVDQRREGEADEQELRDRGRRARPRSAAGRGACAPQNGTLDWTSGQRQRQDESEMAEFGDHGDPRSDAVLRPAA